jgi:hypothetical protein
VAVLEKSKVRGIQVSIYKQKEKMDLRRFKCVKEIEARKQKK